ncbi:MAG TPA: MBL fold metallo-hydrolase [Flavisolibacter sp.]|nr:MBL fold metallo-hydrolase [Flavisolibacter sp.]
MHFTIEGSDESNICNTCGTRYTLKHFNAQHCKICLDERQYVGDGGQQWVSYRQLADSRTLRFSQLQSNLYDLRINPTFALGQKAHLALSSSGNILWDCVPFIDAPTIAFIQSKGGLKAIAVSHPHYYSLMAVWARMFSCPIYLHKADQRWVLDEDTHIEYWEGDEKPLWDGMRLNHTGGHFDGSTILHLPNHGHRGTILVGDSLYVSRDGKQLSAMYSYPNMLPLPAKAIRNLIKQVQPLTFDSLYGYGEWMNIPKGAYDIFLQSMQRYLSTVSEQ